MGHRHGSIVEPVAPLKEPVFVRKVDAESDPRRAQFGDGAEQRPC
jgi:hypothetical protein